MMQAVRNAAPPSALDSIESVASKHEAAKGPSYVRELDPSGRGRRPVGTARMVPVRHFGRVVSQSPRMHDVFDVLDRFSRADVTVTLLGETGVGKDVFARAMHQISGRASGPLIVFDCGAVAASLVESELLGHERGAFTGAVSSHPGAFERANGGTLFLDEIAELPLELQPRLLRALESRQVRRVGGRTDYGIDVRVIAATNRDIKAEVAAGRFREDLYFRLAVAVVSIPALRQRVEDMGPLCQELLADLGRPDVIVSEAALALFASHPWPGNVRELKNALACAVAFVDQRGGHIEPPHVRLVDGVGDEASWLDGLPLGGQTLEAIERAAVRQTLQQSRGNRAAAARSLGIAVSTLYEKVKKFGL